MLPPNIVCTAAPTVPKTDRDRTTTPRTTPRLSTIRNPGTSKPVVVMLDGMSAACDWMMEDMSHVLAVSGQTCCKLCGLQRPGDFVSTEDDAGRHCFRADELE